MPIAKNLADLLQQAEKLTADIDTGEEVPRVHRNLQQLAETGQRLLDRTAHVPDDSMDVKASILLGSHGIDVPKVSQKLDSLNAAMTLEPIEPVWETDIEGFLRNESENTLISLVEESRRSTLAEAELYCKQAMEEDWEREKEKILNSLLGGGSTDLTDLPTEPEVLHTTPLSMHGRSSLDAVAMAYAREIYVRNESFLQELPRGLVSALHKASKNFQDRNAAECWELLKAMVDLPTLPPDAHEHRFSSGPLQKSFVANARAYLEKQYLQFVEDVVYSSPQQAQLGGVPGTFQLVKSFLSMRQIGAGVEGVEGQPLWALIFYCMRCGDLADALAVAKKAPSFGEFAGYLQEYMHSEDQRLSPSSEAKLRVRYKSSVSPDPYERAMHCILARCDAGNNHPETCVKTEDYIWLKLCQVQLEVPDDFPPPPPPPSSHHHSSHLTLPELQRMLLEEYGERHFNARQQPYLYFKVLLLTAQFEAALEFLWRIDYLQVHAVHFAIALQDMKLLCVTDYMHSQMLKVDSIAGTRELNFARMVVNYTRRFALTDPREALEYFFLLKGTKVSEDRDLFATCVSNLAIESREFEMILGKMQPDGVRKAGCVDKFQLDNTPEVIAFVAMEAAEKGLHEDAIRLYDLAQNHEKVMQLLNGQLSRVASDPPVPHSNRDRLYTLALSIADRYRAEGHSASKQKAGFTFFLLLDIMHFFDCYHSKKIDLALTVMKQLKLLPLQAGETVEQKVTAFRNYHNEVRLCFPDILLATMNILFTQYKQTSQNLPTPTKQDGGQEKFKTELRRLARALITFAGMIPYQMPGDSNARLVQMEVLMS